MDLCRNITVSGGLTSECQPDQLFSSSCSKIGSLDDLFSSHNMVEGGNDDVGSEWLSMFVEDCLASSGNCLPVPLVPTNITNEVNEKKKTSSSSSCSSAGRLSTAFSSKSQSTSTTRFDGLPNKFVKAAGKGARSKRKRIPLSKSKSQVISSSSSWSGWHIPLEMTGCCSSVDPPLLQRTYWLADSELVFPKKDDDQEGGGRSRSRERSAERDGKGVVVLLEEMIGGEEEEEGKEGNKSGKVSNGQQQEGRRCSHCLSQRTPQWRAGPLGPKTLCNACGVRYKSGRLLPEYRPAKSPTFVSYLHSNSHKKVLEMRQSILSSHSSS